MRVIQNAAAAWSAPFRSSMKGKLFVVIRTLMRISKKAPCINYSDLDQVCSAPKMDLPHLQHQVYTQTPSPRAINKTPNIFKFEYLERSLKQIKSLTKTKEWLSILDFNKYSNIQKNKTPRYVKEKILRLPSDSITLLDSKPSHSKLGDQLLVSMNPKS